MIRALIRRFTGPSRAERIAVFNAYLDERLTARKADRARRQAASRKGWQTRRRAGA